ncbi:MAG TPA: hypothetical protein VHO24_12320 [Opitutaceae bacterium]|nr:hypothetical protein [Opitutaceae bacterium]
MKKFFFKASPSRALRSTLIDLYSTGTMQVFRRHSLLRLWVPLREGVSRSDNSWAE